MENPIDPRMVITVTFKDKLIEGKMRRAWKATAEGVPQSYGDGLRPEEAVGDLVCRFAEQLGVFVKMPLPEKITPPPAE